MSIYKLKYNIDERSVATGLVPEPPSEVPPQRAKPAVAAPPHDRPVPGRHDDHRPRPGVGGRRCRVPGPHGRLQRRRGRALPVAGRRLLGDDGRVRRRRRRSLLAGGVRRPAGGGDLLRAGRGDRGRAGGVDAELCAERRCRWHGRRRRWHPGRSASAFARRRCLLSRTERARQDLPEPGNFVVMLARRKLS